MIVFLTAAPIAIIALVYGAYWLWSTFLARQDDEEHY